MSLPEPVHRATKQAEQAGFAMRARHDACRPAARAHLLVDDMTPGEFADDHHVRETLEVRARLLDHLDLASVEIGWPTGLILSTRRRMR